ncbi:hypothetical protein C8J57DRAFT_1501470 [Mycena rebaudengoi]|nr:hypothetical protein C8J57DRAFT_1501470 [Mycena rebaudengoi]
MPLGHKYPASSSGSHLYRRAIDIKNHLIPRRRIDWLLPALYEPPPRRTANRSSQPPTTTLLAAPPTNPNSAGQALNLTVVQRRVPSVRILLFSLYSDLFGHTQIQHLGPRLADNTDASTLRPISANLLYPYSAKFYAYGYSEFKRTLSVALATRMRHRSLTPAAGVFIFPHTSIHARFLPSEPPARCCLCLAKLYAYYTHTLRPHIYPHIINNLVPEKITLAAAPPLAAIPAFSALLISLNLLLVSSPVLRIYTRILRLRVCCSGAFNSTIHVLTATHRRTVSGLENVYRLPLVLSLPVAFNIDS